VAKELTIDQIKRASEKAVKDMHIRLGQMRIEDPLRFFSYMNLSRGFMPSRKKLQKITKQKESLIITGK